MKRRQILVDRAGGQAAGRTQTVGQHVHFDRSPSGAAPAPGSHQTKLRARLSTFRFGGTVE
jgi:hypothetical protein